MRGCTPKPALLGPIGTTGIFGVFEIVFNLLETILRCRIISFKIEIPPIYDGIDKMPWIGEEPTTSWHSADSFEPKGIPNATRGYISLID